MKNKEKFYHIIQKKLIEGSKEVQDYVKRKIVVEGRLEIYQFNKIIRNVKVLEHYNTSVLVWFAEALHSFNENLCNVNEFFEPIEIDNAKLYINKSENIEQYFTFYNAFEIAPNQYQCLASVTQIGKLRKHNIIRVDFEAQRDSVVKKYGDNEIRLIKINSKRVEEISEKINNEEYAFNEIRLNLLKGNDGLPLLQFNPNNHTITIDKEDFIIVLDGNHRSLACERLLAKYPEKEDLFKERFFSLLITNETIMGSKKIVAQEWNREPVAKNQIKSMERKDSNIVVEMLMGSDSADPLYSKRIVKTNKEIKFGNGFILFPVLASAIERYYGTENIKTLAEKQKLRSWLEEVFNEITAIFKNEFINFNEVKTKWWNVSPYAWYLFVGLSYILEGKEDWKDNLVQILNSFDWNMNHFPYGECINSNLKLYNKTNELLRGEIK